jgi:hypothetical protein
VSQSDAYGGRTRERDRTAGVHVGRFGIGTVGGLTVLIAAWGALIPFVGPLFGYSADGAGSWHWSFAHALLAVVPGAVGVIMGFVILRDTRAVVRGRGRVSLAVAGFITLLSGAWFIVGPLAWPVVTTHGAVFVGAPPLRTLANEVGYALGTGLILVFCGGYTMGWAGRHQSRAVPAVADASTPMAAPAEASAPAARPTGAGRSGDAEPAAPAAAPVAAPAADPAAQSDGTQRQPI